MAGIESRKDETMHTNDIVDGKIRTEPFVLVNVLEEMMRLELPKIMAQFDMCTCERCVCDVLAIALNSMLPKYVVTHTGELFAKVESYGNQYKTDILSKLTQACTKVRQTPSHS